MKLNLNNPVIKGGIILLLTALLSLTSNWPETKIQWEVFAFTTLGTLMLYFAQSSFFPSTSESGQLNGKDLLKGLLVAAGNALSTWGANAMEGTAINVKALVISMVGLFAGYLLKQWQSTAPKS